MTEISRILDQFRRAYDGDAWYGTPICQILRDISSTQAISRTIPQAHSIWELLLHITAWEREALRRLETGTMDMPEDGDWNVVVDSSEAAWNNAKQRFHTVHTALEQKIATLSDKELQTVLGTKRVRETGEGVPVYVLLHGIIQHSIYHAGQIALLRKSFES